MQVCRQLAMLLKHTYYCRAAVHVMIKQSRCLQKATLHYDQLCLSSHAFLVSPVPTAVHGVLLL